MEKNKRKIWMITLVIIFIVIIMMKLLFFFNPISFRRDTITYLPFYMYRNPMSYSYWGDDVEEENIKDNEAIHFMYKELKKSDVLGNKFPEGLSTSNTGQLCIYSYHSELGKSNTTDITWYGDESGIIRISGYWFIEGELTQDMYIKSTEDLRVFLNNHFEGED